MLRKRYPLMNEAGDENGKPSTPAPPEVFSKEYVKELRHENAGYRLRAQEAEKKISEAEERVKKLSDEFEAKASESNKAAQLRIIRSELKAHAVKAGIVDLDGLQFADLKSVKFDDAGEVVGAEEVIEALRKSKPYLFTKTTASTEAAPKAKPATTVKASEMSADEYKAYRAKHFSLR